jgi:arylsulfatase A-like enzyme
MKNTIITLLIGLVLPITWGNAAEKPGSADQQGKPNIILFLVDDMGLMDTSVPFVVDADGKPVRYPLNEFYRTPNMEKLAEAGTLFTSFYAHSICSPTRVSILTGQNSARHRTTNFVLAERNNPTPCGPKEWNWTGPGKDTVVFPRLLQQAGYRTIHVGKAHWGPVGSYAEDPHNLGFDVNIGGNSGGSPGSYYGKDGFGQRSGNKKRAVPHLEKYHGKDVFLTEALTLEAIAAIDKAKEAGKPFFLHMSLYAVHAPFMANPAYTENYENSDPKYKWGRPFATLVEGADKSLGDIVNHVKKMGLGENTLLFFLGDNGSASPLPKKNNYGSSAPLKGKKGQCWEGGTRVPFIASWITPAKNNPLQKRCPVAVNAIQTQPGNVTDLLPTICKVTEVNVPRGHTIDGVPLQPQLAGMNNAGRKNEFLNHFPHRHAGTSYFTSYVKGDWKVIYHYPAPVTNEKYEKTSSSVKYELFNLQRDPFEQEDMAASHPEKLQMMMTALIKDLEAKNALYPELGKKVLRPRLSGSADR